MIIDANTLPSVINNAVRGGSGSVTTHQILSETAGSKIKFFALNRLSPGGTVGLHEHHGEEEFYFCLAGRGVVTDSTGEAPFTPGVFQITRNGEQQALRNTGETELIFIAGLISA